MAEHFDRLAEQSALGGMMLDARRVWDVLDVVSPAEFHLPSHEIIATAIQALANRGEGTDTLMVHDEIARMGDSIPEGIAYLSQLTSVTPTAANAGYHAEIVKTKAIRRRLAHAAFQVGQIAEDSTIATDEQIERARAALDSVLGSQKSEAQPVGHSIDDVIVSMAEPPVFSPTPWGSINHLIGGLRPGCMYVIGARPGAGKTAMGMNMAVQLAQAGPVAFCSLEMSESELQKRLLAQLGDVHMNALVNNAFIPQDWDRIAEARKKIEGLPIYISDNAAATLATIRGYARSVSRRGELHGLVVDYVQLLQGSDPAKSRQQVVGEFSRGMKLIAKEFQIPVIVLSQLNRKSEERIDRKPSIADLRESGDLEQDADVVLLLSRDDRDAERIGEVNVQIAKNRHGPTGETDLAWLGHYARMDELGGGFNPAG